MNKCYNFAIHVDLEILLCKFSCTCDVACTAFFFDNCIIHFIISTNRKFYGMLHFDFLKKLL